jgi:hypothetical protein
MQAVRDCPLFLASETLVRGSITRRAQMWKVWAPFGLALVAACVALASIVDGNHAIIPVALTAAGVLAGLTVLGYLFVPGTLHLIRSGGDTFLELCQGRVNHVMYAPLSLRYGWYENRAGAKTLVVVVRGSGLQLRIDQALVRGEEPPAGWPEGVPATDPVPVQRWMSLGAPLVDLVKYGERARWRRSAA